MKISKIIAILTFFLIPTFALAGPLLLSPLTSEDEARFSKFAILNESDSEDLSSKHIRDFLQTIYNMEVYPDDSMIYGGGQMRFFMHVTPNTTESCDIVDSHLYDNIALSAGQILWIPKIVNSTEHTPIFAEKAIKIQNSLQLKQFSFAITLQNPETMAIAKNKDFAISQSAITHTVKLMKDEANIYTSASGTDWHQDLIPSGLKEHVGKIPSFLGFQVIGQSDIFAEMSVAQVNSNDDVPFVLTSKSEQGLCYFIDQRIKNNHKILHKVEWHVLFSNFAKVFQDRFPDKMKIIMDNLGESYSVDFSSAHTLAYRMSVLVFANENDFAEGSKIEMFSLPKDPDAS